MRVGIKHTQWLKRNETLLRPEYM